MLTFILIPATGYLGFGVAYLCLKFRSSEPVGLILCKAWYTNDIISNHFIEILFILLYKHSDDTTYADRLAK